ncbi:hypothetical protein [Mycobacteroides chelonae]|uniref:hypothetical protein n=1 Tax=Mycobacteroides chelonae TaxID=1774 RepID=UPI0004AA7B8A|nr:hypothetical protein [Mycobacteroides chelonae]OHT67812.1 hypothetical protein BKG66_24620 [Mycobacteroides chelonae]OHT69455.1 hypothetical protein BKG67_23155 [Mycobacteroides chelonae]
MKVQEAAQLVESYDGSEVLAGQVGFVVAMNNVVDRYGGEIEFDALPEPLLAFLTDVTTTAEEYLKTGE